jgi:hypothetical protein
MRLEKEDMDRALEYAGSIREFVRSQAPGQFETDDKTQDKGEE